MEQIRNYFRNWRIARIIRIVLAVCLLVAYYYNHEFILAFTGVILTIQAIFNISCPGGSCFTGSSNSQKTKFNF
jgi:hypothetical protein